jgi:methylmalonyl-CoA/ethylmalonyl-CoA epimerase
VSIGRVDHTAIAVNDLEAALRRYVALLPGAAIERSVVADQQVVVAFLRLGDTAVELIQPTSADSGVARFLAQRGEGLHHIAFEVDDLQSELRRLESEGIELVDREPRPGAHGMVAFLHPRSTGVLVELVQHTHREP